MKKVLFLIIIFLLISTSFVNIIKSTDKESSSYQSDFIQNYLSQHNLFQLLKLTKNFERNDIVGTITLLKPFTLPKTTGIMSVQENEQTYLINLKNSINNEEINFLLKVEKIEDKTILTMFNDEGGVKIDFTNKIVLETWSSHNTCNYWTCVENYMIVMILTNPEFWVSCGTVCLLDPSGISCVTCAIIWGAQGFLDCSSNSCAWYPCQQDCPDNNYYNSNYEYYCKDSGIWKHRYYHAYMCPDYITYGQNGTCIVDNVNSEWRNETFVANCPDGCSNGECNDMIILCDKMTTNCMSSCKKCPSVGYEYCVYSYESSCKHNNPTSGNLLPGESIPWLSCTSSRRCVLRGKPLVITTTTTTIPPITDCDPICNNKKTVNCAISCKKCPVTFNGKIVTYCPYSYDSICNDVLEKHGRKTSGMLLPGQSLPWLTCSSSGICNLKACYGTLPFE